jgi:hypothetical protein
LVLCFGSERGAAQVATQLPKTPPVSPAALAQQQPVAIRPDIDQPASPADGQLPPEAHPWGRFPVGSWKNVRVTSETLDAQGRIVNTSVTETKTTLVAANDHEYQLKIETTVEVAGKRFAHPAQVTRHTYWGELATAAPNGLRKVSTSELELNGRKVACEVRQALSEREGERRQTVVHYTTTQFPYIGAIDDGGSDRR